VQQKQAERRTMKRRTAPTHYSPTARSFFSTSTEKAKGLFAGKHERESSDASNLRRVCFRSVNLFLLAAIGVMRLPGGEKHADEYMKSLYAILGGTSFKGAADSLFITVQTTQCHHERVRSILDTYWKFAPESTVFFTDSPPSPSGGKWEEGCENKLPTIIQLDPPLDNPTRDNFSLVNTLCDPTHQIQGFCCKTASAIVYYHEHSDADWMCHVNDDTYLNYPEMVKYLKQFDPSEEHYIGFPPTANAIRTAQVKRKQMFDTARKEHRKMVPNVNITFHRGGDAAHMDHEMQKGAVRVTYGIGESGWCLSRPLVVRGMYDFANMEVDCANIVYPDDVTLGYLIQEKLRGPKMQVAPTMNSASHVFASRNEAKAQLTISATDPSKLASDAETAPEATKRQDFSFASWPGSNIVDERTGLPPDDDPLGFKALHCNFYPSHC